ncbi:SPOR domain-containing protein [Paenibacillus cymbidii]|uniref:SPOR domain-containing protein n=1 Tax=Paenibacillus cymbidii TaxID=1639034 RepID=UPI0010822A07|nr:SPOR domain-containing protein [Paenibacillus cymbidii]
MNKARITYRINREPGKETAAQGETQRVIPLYGEEYHVVEEKVQPAKKQEPVAEAQQRGRGPEPGYAAKSEPVPTGWNSPFDEETERIERLILESNERRQSARDRTDERRPPVGSHADERERERGRAERQRPFEAQEPVTGEHDRQSRAWQEEMRGGDRYGKAAGHAAGQPSPGHGGEAQPPYRQAGARRELQPQRDWELAPDPITNEWLPVERQSQRMPAKGDRREQERKPVRGSGGMRLEDEWDYRMHDAGLRDDRYQGRLDDYDRRDDDPPPHPPLSVTGPRYVRHSRTPWMKIAATVVGAVITGGLLGLLVLSLFSGQSLGELTKLGGSGGSAKETSATTDKNASAAPASASTDGKSAAGVKDSAVGANAAANTIAVSIPAKSYVFLQNGGFAGEQGAATAQAELRKSGFAGVTEAADKYYVYAGVAGTKEDAQALSDQLKAKKFEVYLKTVTIPAASRIVWNGKAEAVQTYIAQSDKLAQMMNALTLLKLESGQTTPLEDATYQSLASAHQSWSQTVAGAAEGASSEAKAQLQKMNNALDTAKLSIDEYKKNRSIAMLWQAQSNVMDYLVAEKKLLQLVTPV